MYEVVDGIFVDGEKGKDVNLGTLDKPVKTITRAMNIVDYRNRLAKQILNDAIKHYGWDKKIKR